MKQGVECLVKNAACDIFLHSLIFSKISTFVIPGSDAQDILNMPVAPNFEIFDAIKKREHITMQKKLNFMHYRG